MTTPLFDTTTPSAAEATIIATILHFTSESEARLYASRSGWQGRAYVAHTGGRQPYMLVCHQDGMAHGVSGPDTMVSMPEW